MASKKVYRVVFYNQDQVYEVYAANLYQSDLYAFIEVEDLIFGERSGLLVDPTEERLKTEFGGVKRSFIPINAIIRIDEVEQGGVAKVKEAKGSPVAPFPLSPVRPGGADK